MNLSDYDDIAKRARPGIAFSNGTEGYDWQGNWCDRCLRDAPFRNGLKGATGCPILLVALVEEKTPAEWMDGPRDEHGRYGICDKYTCIEFRAPGDGGGEPRPKPEPPSMDGLFPRPERQTRMYIQPELRRAEVS